MPQYKWIAANLTAFFLLQSPVQSFADVIESTWADFKSPYTTPARPVLLWGSALAITFAVFEDQVSDPLQTRTTSSRPLGNVATDLGHLAGSLLPNVAYAGSMLLGNLITGDREMQSRGNLMIRASAYAQLTTTALKYIIREPRPDGSGEKVSFPSGHSTAAFSFASVIQAEHGWVWGAAAYTYATLVAYGRMNDNRHLLHDVVAGATIGMSFGLGLYYRDHANESNALTSLNLLPTHDLQGAVLNASLQF